MTSSAREHLEAARSWIDAFNRHDLDAIMEHYAEDVTFEAPTVVNRWGREDGVVRGLDELRRHFAMGLELAPNLRFDLEEVLESPSGYAMLYRRDNGNRVVEVIEPDQIGRARRVTVFYARDPA